MNIETIERAQARLAAAGYDPGSVDGILGPRTYAALFSYAAGRPLEEVGAALGRAAARHFPTFGITTPPRLAHFIAQAAHETMAFRFFTEIGGPTYCARYEGRADLGNTQPGDGYRFKGRGIFQLTGRANYARFGARLGLDLVAQPDKAADPEVSLHIACLYWQDRRINPLADADDVAAVTRKINGGRNGLAERAAYTQRLKAMFDARGMELAA